MSTLKACDEHTAHPMPIVGCPACQIASLRDRVAELEAVNQRLDSTLTRIRTEDLSRFDCTLLAAQAQGLLK